MILTNSLCIFYIRWQSARSQFGEAVRSPDTEQVQQKNMYFSSIKNVSVSGRFCDQILTTLPYRQIIYTYIPYLNWYCFVLFCVCVAFLLGLLSSSQNCKHTDRLFTVGNTQTMHNYLIQPLLKTQIIPWYCFMVVYYYTGMSRAKVLFRFTELCLKFCLV